MNSKRVSGFLALLIVLTLLHLLYSAIAAFTWGRVALFDYTKFLNMLWNCAHGAPFRVFVDGSFLRTHLTFSLVLVGQALHVWDHPFLPWLLQWMYLVIGGAILAVTMHRLKLPSWLGLSVVFFVVAYPFTQSVVLSGFYEVGLYLLLVPWLHYCLLFSRKWAWLPVALMCGVREEAGLFVIPLLVYVAAREKWAWGYLLAAAAALYVALAMLVIFPAITGMSLGERRPEAANWNIYPEVLRMGAQVRLTRLLWLLLPVLPLLRRGWLPMVSIPAVAVLISLGSPHHEQFGLRYHYPSAVMACMGVAVVESLRRQTAWDSRRRMARLIACCLMTVTLIAHLSFGYLPGGGASQRWHLRIHPEGLAHLRVAASVPREGVLLTTADLAIYCANRAEIIPWDFYDPERFDVDHVWVTLQDLAGRHGSEARAFVTGGEFGVTHFDGRSILLSRGAPTGGNREVMDQLAVARRTLLISRMAGEPQRNVNDRQGRTLRYWNGDGARGPVTLAHGRGMPLAPGRYQAVFRLRAAAPRREVRGSWGRLSLHPLGQERVLAEAEIEPVADLPGVFREQALAFELTEPVQVEPRVSGGDAELWLDRVIFHSLEKGERP